MRSHALLASLFTLALLCGPSGAAGEALDVDAAGQPRIVNGVTTHDYPTTGALLYGSSGGSARLQCSGTLIGCQTFLTAAHCVVDDSNPAHYFVYLQNVGVVSVTRVVPNDDYRTGASPDSGTFPIFDVAVLTLGAQVTGVDPTAINQTDPEPFIPHAATIVGYGQTLGGAGNYGIKRAGAVQTENCNPAFIPNGAGNDEVICWSYTNPVGPPGTDSNTCNGDSGGPLFMDLGSGVVLAGTTSGGTDGACNVGDHSYDANVFTYDSFILGRLGSDSTGVCGPIPGVGTGSVSVVSNDGTLTSSHTSDSYSVTVSSPKNALRFSLNGEDNGALDADLYVRQGAPATTTLFDCKADASGNFGACTFQLPAVATWHVLVNRASGQGTYQLTTTIFGGSQPVCGNNSTETGEECDGTDDGACDGLCNNVACTCPPPSCGNGVAEQGEQCDGADTGNCLGSCQGNCTCTPVCGDDKCSPGETALGCPIDCGCSSAGSCAFGNAPGGCFCDDVCEGFGDCCPDACTQCDACTAGCGNGILEIGEQCDDGNTAAGDCCSPTCQLVPGGTACNDGTDCTASDQCDGAGSCVGAPDVVTTCFQPGKASLRIDDRSGVERDRLRWNWLRGDAVGFSDMGNPAASTAYELCVYDRQASQPQLVASARLAPSAIWEQNPGVSWSFSDGTAFFDGLHKIRLQTGGDGFAKVKLKAKGPRLELPGPVQPGYFEQDPSVVVQLRNTIGRCWSAEFTSATLSEPDIFSARLP